MAAPAQAAPGPGPRPEGSESSHQGHQHDPMAVWLTALRLLAVAPAALQQQQQQQAAQAAQAAQQQPQAAGQQPLPHHDVLLHLAATVSRQPLPQQAEPQPVGQLAALLDSALGVAIGACPLLPLPVQQAVLQTVLLSRNGQVIVHKQCYLAQLIEQQQQLELPQQEQGQQEQGQQEQGQQEQQPHAGSSQTLLLHLQLSAPSQPSAQALDVLHLVLTLCGTQLEEGGGGGGGQPHAGPPAALVADVPLLLMPAAAQQEVQRLLLPAMRQDLQAELQQRSPGGAPSAAELVLQSVRVEHGSWSHWHQLSLDILLVLQLSEAAAEEAAAAAAAAAAGAEPPAAAPGASSQLLRVAATMLLPLLLPFLAGHGLHNTLRLLLDCLPPHLRQQWQQEQLARLQTLTAASQAAPSPPQPQPQPGAAADVAQAAAGAAAGADASASAAAVAGAVPGPHHHQQQPAAKAASSSSEGDARSSWPAAAPAGGGSSTPGSTVKGSPPQAVPAGAGAQHAPAWQPQVSWLLPLAQFPDQADERSYLAWKHGQLLHFDQMAIAFEASYLAVLLRRLAADRATVFYVAFLLLKALPHVPLLCGATETYLRHRELWLFLVPPLCTLVLCAALLAGAQPSLPNRAYNALWRVGGEVLTSMLRPFLLHMRLRPYLIYCLLDGATSAFVLGRANSHAGMALARWALSALVSAALCWGLDGHMRRRWLLLRGGDG